MSLVRFGDDSDVYMIGLREGTVQCCGCRFTPMGTVPEIPADIQKYLDKDGTFMGATAEEVSKWHWYLESFPEFTTVQEIVDHLDKHKEAGHLVPRRAYASAKGCEFDWGDNEKT